MTQIKVSKILHRRSMVTKLLPKKCRASLRDVGVVFVLQDNWTEKSAQLQNLRTGDNLTLATQMFKSEVEQKGPFKFKKVAEAPMSMINKID